MPFCWKESKFSQVDLVPGNCFDQVIQSGQNQPHNGFLYLKLIWVFEMILPICPDLEGALVRSAEDNKHCSTASVTEFII